LSASRRHRALAAGLVLAVTAAVSGADLPGGRAAEQPRRIGTVGGPYRVPWPVWGFTHTDRSADLGPASAVAARALSRVRLLQNQHIMGWGADNPQPAPDRYDFTALDRRISYIRRTGGIPVITLCCAPDWMKGGSPGETDWFKLEVAPEPRFFDDFARLAATIARRYPDVRHYAVWNELKGFYDEERDRWRHEDYTELYNRVYDALKAVDPQIKVGGPYVPMYSHVRGRGSPVRGPWGSVDQIALDAVDYWLTHKNGADFLTVDGPTASDDLDVYPDEASALSKFVAINRWLRSRTDLPLWWHEYYVEPLTDPWGEAKRAAMNAASLIDQARTGVSAVLYWNRMPKDGNRICEGCLWVTTSVRDGGKPGRMLGVLQSFARFFPAGTPLLDIRSTTPWRVRVLAQPRKVLAVNVSGGKVATRVGGFRLTLRPYEIRWLDRR
jgi:glycosyl hydrolase family 39 (putative alpha-L-iduronidase)